MNYVQFPGCCGAYILKDFGGTQLSMHQRSYTEEEIRAFLTNSEDGIRRARHSFMLATLNHEQYPKYIKIFKELGWRCLKKEKHKYHSSTIYLMFKSLN